MEEFYCQMAVCLITGDLCDSEQGARECRGCGASTRRCSRCGKKHKLVELDRGLCEACFKKLQGKKEVLEFQQPLGINEQVAPEELELMRSFQIADSLKSDTSVNSVSHCVDSNRKKNRLRLPLILKSPEKLLTILKEHQREDKDGSFIVREPSKTLQIRAKLLPNEAEGALNLLVQQGLVIFNETTTVAKIVCRPDVQMPLTKHQLKQPAMETAHATDDLVVISATSSSVAKDKKEPKRVASRKLPSVRPSKNYGEVYAELLKSAGIIGGQHILKGAIALLQLRYRLGPQDAIRILEWYENGGYITRRDGWRSVILQVETVVSKESIFEGVTKRCLHYSQTKNASSPPISRQRELTSKSGAETASAENLFEETIKEMTMRLEEFKILRDNASSAIESLESALRALKTVRETYRKTQTSVDKAQSQARQAIEALIAKFRTGSL